MNFSTSPSGIVDHPVSCTDADGLVYLFDEVVAADGPLALKRAHLLDRLCELLGADGWAFTSGIVSSPSPSPHACTGQWHRFECTGPIITSSKTSPTQGSHSIIIHRKTGKPPFTAREQRLARIIMEEVSWLHDEGPSLRGLPVSTRHDQILDLLVHGHDRKSISELLGISPNTTSSYIRAIYRDQRVNSQIELMSKHQET